MADTVDEIFGKIKNEKDIFAKAKLISTLRREKNVKVIDIAEKLGINSSYVCHINRLNKLPDIIVDAYYSKLISISHLFLLSRLNDKQKMVDIYEKILTQNLSVKDTEDAIREYLYEIKNRGHYIKEKERQFLMGEIAKKNPDVNAALVQTRTRSRLALEIKGNLEKTSKSIKELVKKII